MQEPVLVGAVVYDPKVVVIWEIIKNFFEDSGCPMDYVFFSNYELQVKALLESTIHVARNLPLAWLEVQRRSGQGCRAIAMRDTDRDRVLATTDLFDHCVFTVRADLPTALQEPWLTTLYSMDYANPAHREMMDMEGLKSWLPGRTTGFSALTEAVEKQKYFAGAEI